MAKTRKRGYEGRKYLSTEKPIHPFFENFNNFQKFNKLVELGKL